MVSFRDRVHAMELSVFGKGGHSAYAAKMYGKPKSKRKSRTRVSAALATLNAYFRRPRGKYKKR